MDVDLLGRSTRRVLYCHCYCNEKPFATSRRGHVFPSSNNYQLKKYIYILSDTVNGAAKEYVSWSVSS